jgi:hypothetical protein
MRLASPSVDPDPDPGNTTAAEEVAADAAGNVYGAEVGPKALKRYVKNKASSGEFVGDGERQRAVLVRNSWNLRQVESKDLC